MLPEEGGLLLPPEDAGSRPMGASSSSTIATGSWVGGFDFRLAPDDGGLLLGGWPGVGGGVGAPGAVGAAG